MIGAYFALAFVIGSFGCLAAEPDLSKCSAVTNMSFSEMEKGECQFIFQSSPPEKMDDSLEALDKVQNCVCNMANKGAVWESLAQDPEVKEFNRFIKNRLLHMAVEQYEDFAKFHADNIIKLPQDKLRFRLEHGASSGIMHNIKSKIDYVKPACQYIISKFERYHQMFNNLNAFAGNEVSTLLARNDPNFDKILSAYRICKKADY